jgi:hypothetical protein
LMRLPFMVELGLTSLLNSSMVTYSIRGLVLLRHCGNNFLRWLNVFAKENHSGNYVQKSCGEMCHAQYIL